MEEARALLAKGESQLRGAYPIELAKLLCRRAEAEHIGGDDRLARVALEEADTTAADTDFCASQELHRAIEVLRDSLGPS
jgi:hypothetical protein